ncbi:MAG: tRNA dihydrouridine(20/20a) synthase DusA [Planktomarina sp.]
MVQTELWPYAKLSVAPMMAWTDRHCRMFHRTLSQQTLLYTEMVTAAAVLHGDLDRLLGHSKVEHPLAVQLGGSDPKDLQNATQICADYGYKEVNLNVGCPSDRVQSGAFGAVLMKQPDLVADCVSAMQDVAGAEVTVKCRVGVDDQDPQTVLPDFIAKIHAVGIRRITIHARRAWLQGLSPKENRDVPPLDYPLARQMVDAFPDMHISLNGGIGSITAAKTHLNDGFHGAMIGRAAYHTPADILLNADEIIYGKPSPHAAPLSAGYAMADYIEAHLTAGGRLHHVTRHMLGLFAGGAGAKKWRQTLSHLGAQDRANTTDYINALNAVKDAQDAAAAFAATRET